MQRLTRQSLACLLALALAWACLPARALSTDERAARESELGRVNETLEESRARIDALKAEIATLGQDRAALNATLIDTAAAIQRHETDLSTAEERLVRLADNEAEIHESLDARRAELIELIAAMQRLGRNPPPAVLLRPQDAADTVRAALLLGAVLPEVRVSAEALSADLAELGRLRKAMGDTRRSQEREIARLAEDREKLQVLLAEKDRQDAQGKEELGQLEVRAAALSREAASLEELVAAMDAEVQEATVSALAPSGAAALSVLRDPARMQPARPFDQARGGLALPVSGERVIDFGAADGLGGAAKGISIATRAGAQVTSPADGWVVYAGPFRSYGQLLILNAGAGYHILLAGMETIDVGLGQFVLAGEPVAAMGSRLLASAASFAPGSDKPVLYVEFRKDGATIDPGPWWASNR